MEIRLPGCCAMYPLWSMCEANMVSLSVFYDNGETDLIAKKLDKN